MAVDLLDHEVSDLCLGKPALRSLSISATIEDALSALKLTGENHLSVWSCDHSKSDEGEFGGDCVCVGKVCMVDVMCFLAREENRANPMLAMKSPVSMVVSEGSGVVRHVEAYTSLVEVIDFILEGAQNLIVPIDSRTSFNSRKKQLQKALFGPTLHNGREYCWLTQEDVIRYLLSLIGLFSPFPALSIETLGIIGTEIQAVEYHSQATSAIDAISDALTQQTSVAVVNEDGKLIGEISPFTLASCDETVAAAITTLSSGDLMAYIDCGGPSEDVVNVVKERLIEKELDEMLGLLEQLSLSSSSSSSSLLSSSSCSSDEEFGLSPSTTLPSTTRWGRYSRSSSYSARMVRRSEAIVCHPRSSLVAVMIQALTHRVNYVWVIEDDYSLAGIVTFSDMLRVFREHLQ